MASVLQDKLVCLEVLLSPSALHRVQSTAKGKGLDLPGGIDVHMTQSRIFRASQLFCAPTETPSLQLSNWDELAVEVRDRCPVDLNLMHLTATRRVEETIFCRCLPWAPCCKDSAPSIWKLNRLLVEHAISQWNLKFGKALSQTHLSLS